jgi:hypothetical protein
MSDIRRKLFVIGSSHAKRIAFELKNLNLAKNFEIVDMARPGATFEKLCWPSKSQVNQGDLILFQGFGNDVFYKKYVQLERTARGKCYHLTKFAPRPLEKLFEDIKKCKRIFEDFGCHVLVINLIIRHNICCPSHRDARVLKQQFKIVKQIKRDLYGDKVTVINPLSLLHMRTKSLKNNMEKQSELMIDSVHFYPKHYRQICTGLEKKYFVKY